MLVVTAEDGARGENSIQPRARVSIFDRFGVATRYDKLAANYLASFNWHRSGDGCALVSPCPNSSRSTYLQMSPRTGKGLSSGCGMSIG
jgi:hypothetical protein